MVECTLQANDVFINARIYDGENFIDADAMIVKEGRFLEITSSSTLPKNSRVIDLKGARVLPGFIESHGHLLGVGQNLLNLDVRGQSIEKIVHLVSEHAQKKDPGTWIRGRGWDQNLWSDKSFPHHRMLDKATLHHPVYLRRVDGHAGWLNKKALEIAGITKNSPCPDGGIIVKDDKGKPTGVLIDRALDLLAPIMEHLDKHQKEQFLKHGVNKALSYGITSFHDAGADRETLDLYTQLAQKKQLDIRLYAMIDGSDQKLVDEYLQKGPQKISDFLSIRSIKYFSDGALGSRGALLLHEYHDQPRHRGLTLMSEYELSEKTQSALKRGFQIATHAIGDGANRLVLNAYETALKKTNLFDQRLRVEHAQLIDPKDHVRFKKLGVIASMQPIHCTADMAWVSERLGSDRIHQRAYPWRSLLSQGAVLAFGSDAPVETLNPIEGIYAAVSRTAKDNNLAFMPEEQLTLKEALRAYFKGGAFAEFNEHNKGRIAPGYFADFVAFDEDIFHQPKEKFLQRTPFMTIVGGKIVYRRG